MCDKAGTAGYTVGHKLKNGASDWSQHVLTNYEHSDLENDESDTLRS